MLSLSALFENGYFRVNFIFTGKNRFLPGISKQIWGVIVGREGFGNRSLLGVQASKQVLWH
jgi:hypothetical protein